MKYFQYFPSMVYTLDGQDTIITNFLARVKIVERLKQHVSVHYDYIVRDGERPDVVAMNLYGSPDYTWLVLVMNNIMSLYDWPLSTAEFDRLIISKYGSQAAAQAETVYLTAEGDTVDAATYATLTTAGSTSSAYDVALEKNETKRRIKAVPAAFAESLVAELRQVMSE